MLALLVLLPQAHAAGSCDGAHAQLDQKTRNRLSRFEAELSQALAKLDRFALKLERQQLRLAEGQAELAEAENLPEDTGSQRRAKQAALEAARKKIKKANRGIAKWAGKLANQRPVREQLFAKIERIDPWRFSAPGPGPEGDPVFLPAWAQAQPSRILNLDFDPALSDTSNGALLKAAIQSLQPGDRLEIGGGVWSINSYFNVTLQGSAQAPIWVVARAGQLPVITRPDAGQNVMNVGNLTPGSSRYICFRGLSFTGGSAGVRLYGSQNVWLDRCEIHHTGDSALTTNTVDTEAIFITRNHIHHTSGYGEGLYLGANLGAVIMRDSVVALNHVHDTAGTQGDGIELKQGSHSNWIVANCVHDCNYPCILVYGTAGMPVNLIERNLCVGSNDNVMQVQGEAIVFNNLAVGGVNAFFSSSHQSSSTNLAVVHNTFVSTGGAAYMTSWNGKQGMLFANNLSYSQSGQAVTFAGGSNNVSATGNMVLGAVYRGPPGGGFSPGLGLSDFVDVTFDGARIQARPASGGVLIGSGDATYGAQIELTGAARSGSLESGCYDSE